MSHTKGPLVVRIENGVPCIRPGDHKAQGHSMGYAPIAKVTGDRRIGGQLENARRIVACVNACEGIPTEKIEGRTIADYVTSEAFLTGMEVHGGMSVGIKGLAVQMLAEQFAGQFVGNGAINFLEVSMTSEKTGPLLVTIQRVHGKTPAQMKADVERQRDELLAAAKNLRDVKGRHHGEQAFKALVEVVAKVEAV